MVIFARLIAQKLSRAAGAMSFTFRTLRAGAAAAAPGRLPKRLADGYTLLFAFSSFVVNS